MHPLRSKGTAPPTVRLWATAHSRWPGEIGYTARRQLAAPEAVARLLDPIGTREFPLVLDAGSGAGYLTFALADFSREVLGIDSRCRSVLLANHIARVTAATRVRFEHRDAALVRTRSRAGLVLANLMSHGGGDRASLLQAFRACARDGAWLIYSEETEGYPLMEMVVAVRARHRRALQARAAQLLNGISQAPRLRFFASGTATGLLERAGWRVERQQAELWHGVPFTQMTWAFAAGAPTAPAAGARHRHAAGAIAGEPWQIARLGLPLAHAVFERGRLPSRLEELLRVPAPALRRPDWPAFEERADQLEAELRVRSGVTVRA